MIATLLVLTLFGSANSALAAREDSFYRTHDQAAAYLIHGLHHWAGIDLRTHTSKAAYCVSAADQAGTGQVHLNRFGVPVFRSFSCVLTVRLASGRNGTRVFPLDLVKEHRGWRVSSDLG